MTQGYILFKVNNKYFLSYKKARELSLSMRRNGVPQAFYGFSLKMYRWEYFYIEGGYDKQSRQQEELFRVKPYYKSAEI